MRILKAFGLVVLFLFMLSASTCKRNEVCENSPYPDQRFTLKNETNDTIHVELYWMYPDTAIGNYNPLFNNNPIAPQGDYKFHFPSNSCWDEYFLNSEFYYVHVFNRDSLKALPWEEIRTNWNGVKMYRFSLSDIQNKDITITHKE